MGSVLLYQNVTHMDKDMVAKIKAAAGERDLIVSTSPDEIREHLDGIEIIVGHAPPDILFGAENCRWVQLFSAGADALLMRHPQARGMDFRLTNVSGIHAISITEHIFALILSLARKIHMSVRASQDRSWLQMDRTDVQEIAGSTMCLLGVGSIGSRVALAARAFDMRVLAVRRHYALAPPQGIEAVYGPHDMNGALAQADWVVSCVPHTPETHEMISHAQFQAMKSEAFFINIGRGKTVDEPALIQALAAGSIRGAGLDVTYEEPNPAPSPLWDMDNVIITSHYSGMSMDYGRRAGEIFLDNLNRYTEGRPLRNQVDKQLGY